MERREITKAVKKALKLAGYPIKSVKYGTGTARAWIEIRLNLNWNEINKIRGEVERLAAKVSGRASWNDNCILVD